MRALEAERALGRMALTQKATTTAILASMLVNVGTVLSVAAAAQAATAAFVGAGMFGALTAINLLKVKRLEKKEAGIMVTA